MQQHEKDEVERNNELISKREALEIIKDAFGSAQTSMSSRSVKEQNIVGDALTTLELEIKKSIKGLNIKNNATLVLPTDKCVEQWWGQRNIDDMFWQEAPFRTNGDVVEEIKTALKYFITVWQR